MISSKFNRFRECITKLSLAQLLVSWTLLYGLTGLTFAFIYEYIPGDTVHKSDIPTKKVDDIIYFSFTTQATVGYGDYSPLGWGRLVTAIQAFIGTSLNALALGILVYKLTKSSSTIEFANVLIYDPNRHVFRIRFWNIGIENVHAVKWNIFSFQPCVEGQEGQYDTVTSEVFLTHYNNELIAPFHLIAVDTKYNEEKHHNEIGCTTEINERKLPLLLSPINISKETTIRINLNGYTHTERDLFFADKDYSFDDIKCGQFDCVDNIKLQKEEKEGKISKAQRISYIKEKLNKYFETLESKCQKCTFSDKCLLSSANKVRSKISC
jgi:Ion channel